MELARLPPRCYNTGTVMMKTASRVAVAVALPLICIAGRQVAVWLFKALGCGGDLKHLHPCDVAGIDLLPVFGIGIFWLPVVAILMLPFSLWVVGGAIADWVRRRGRRAS